MYHFAEKFAYRIAFDNSRAIVSEPIGIFVVIFSRSL